MAKPPPSYPDCKHAWSLGWGRAMRSGPCIHIIRRKGLNSPENDFKITKSSKALIRLQTIFKKAEYVAILELNLE